MKRKHRLLLALLSALLLSIPFFRWGTGLVLLVAFVPLLLIEDDLSRKFRNGSADPKAGKKTGRKTGLIWYALLSFSVFVLLTTYWVFFATWVGIVASLIVNAGYMTLTFLLFSWTRRRMGDRLGYASLVLYWLTYEFLYLRATVNFPWLVLGNGFANDVVLIQWYEWTGALGGTLWALLMNLAVFRLVKGWLEERAGRGQAAGRRFLAVHRTQISWVVGLFLVPFLVSLIRYLTYEEKVDPYEIVVLQPNIDPYAKFVDMPQEQQTDILLHLADSLTTPETDYIVGPETFINNTVWESQIGQQPEVMRLKMFLEKFPEAKMVIGATTFRLYRDPSQYTKTSKPIQGGAYRYDSFNSAIQLDASNQFPVYHKSLLVVGVEFMPYTQLLGFLEGLTIKLGGTFRSHGTQEFRETFASPQDGTRVAPVICWESVFGEYVTDYVKEAGANFLFIITNDGWWRNTPGHRQHNSYARLRAIETRRSIARSANTGISALIDQRGVEQARIGWWERSGLRGTLNKNDRITIYVKYGDYLGRISSFLTVILLLFALTRRFMKKYK